MALVTIKRSPSPSNAPESLSLSSDAGDGSLAVEKSDDGGFLSPHKSKSFSENYLAVKGAALILPQSECAGRSIARSNGGDIQRHLQLMIYLLRPQDTIKVAVKLESVVATRNRYLALVASTGRQDTEECIMLGIDIQNDKATIGLMVPIWGDTYIQLDGDGGFFVTSDFKEHIFKPVSVQAMWSALQSLMKMSSVAQQHNYLPKGLTHTWTTYYEVRINSDQSCINEWNMMEDLHSKRGEREALIAELDAEELEDVIRTKLKEIMMTVDLEEVTCRYLRTRLEEEMGMNLNKYKAFIDEEMITILGQMDSPSQIFDFLYLGSEWNASNMEELHQNGVGYILNVTREIDNFFPGNFDYFNVRLWDVETSELIKHWDKTYKYIKRAKHSHSKVLVHCKMGISRSAATVTAFAMKEYGWSLEEALKYVRERRAVVRPNKGFMNQLVTYQGILDASKQRHNMLWRSPSASNLSKRMTQMSIDDDPDPLDPLDLNMSVQDIGQCRPRSWSPTDGASELLYKTKHMAFDADSSDEEESSSTYMTSYASIQPTMTSSTQPRVTSDSSTQQDMASHSSELQRDFSDANIPMPFKFDDFDEYDISSRSADSLDIDEAFLESFTPDEKLEVLLEDHPVILLQYRMLDFETESRVVEEIVSYPYSEESDFEDFDPDLDQKPVRGFYDVSMLTGCLVPSVSQPEVFMNRENGNLNMDVDTIGELPTLHPDMKLELALAEYRKNYRIAKFIKLQQLSREEMKASGAQLIQAESEVNRTTSPRDDKHSEMPIPHRVRKDDFWIRAQSIAQDPASVEFQSETEPTENWVFNLEGVCTTESSSDMDTVHDLRDDTFKPIELQKSPESEMVQPVSVEFVSAMSNSPPEIEIPSAQPVHQTKDGEPLSAVELSAQPSEPENTKMKLNEPQSEPIKEEVQSNDSTPTKEVGVWQHYQKEAIPWSPGTVRRKRQEMEDKFTASDTSEATSSRKTSAVTSSDTTQPSRDGMNLDLQKHEERISQSKIDSVGSPVYTATPDSVFGSPTHDADKSKQKPRDISYDQSQDAKPIDAKQTDSPSKPDATNQTGGKRTQSDNVGGDSVSGSSIYALEDIPHVPDRVRRIKELLEDRERSCSYGDIHSIEPKTVQRSSSWKHNRPASDRFDRNSARRKTVLPVIRPFTASKTTPRLSKDDFNFGEVSVKDFPNKKPDQTEQTSEVDKGQVEGHKDEVKVITIGGDTVEMEKGKVKKHQKEYEEKSSSGSLSVPQRDGRSVSPFAEETIQPVSVLKQTRDKHKYAGSPTQSPDSSEKRAISRERSKTTVVEHTVVLHTQISKNRTRSESSPLCDSAVSHASAKELVPTFERILRKSPSLARKLGRSEVIACHSPDSDNTFHSISSIAESYSSSCDNSVSDSVPFTDSKVPASKTHTATQSDLEHSPKTRRGLLKAASVPLMILEVSNQSSEISSTLDGAQERSTQTGVPIYVEEGIDWNVGTVKQQLQAKFESMVIKSDSSSLSSSSTNSGESKPTFDQSKEVVVKARTNQIELEGSQVNTTKMSQKVEAVNSSVVKKIAGKIEGKHKRRKTRVLIIEKTKGIASVSRARSVGSRKDTQVKQTNLPSTSQVVRASSFKEDNCPQFRTQKSEKTDDSSDVKQYIQSQIASHKPSVAKVPKKQVVIIPKVDSNINRPTSSQKSIAGTMNQSKTVSVGSDQSQHRIETSREEPIEKPYCDINKDFLAMVANQHVSVKTTHDDNDSNEDISVKELCDLFEPKDKQICESSILNQRTTDDLKSNIGPSKQTDQNTNSVPHSVSKKRTGTHEHGTIPRAKPPLPSHCSFDSDGVSVPRKTRKLHGKSHPLSKLPYADAVQSMTRGKLYSTM